MTASRSESSPATGALWALLRLHFRGVFRRIARGARTPRGIVFFALGILVLGAWLGPSFYQAGRMPRTDPQTIRTVGPFAILGFCVGNLIFSFGENAVAFTPAEVDFLFPGPFSRRSLLGYKILKSAMGTIFTAMIFAVMMRRYSGSFCGCLTGVWLTIQFMQLFAMAVVMFGQTVGQRAYTAGRRGILLAVLAVATIAAAPKLAAGFQSGPVEFMRQVHANIGARVLLAPFDVFARSITATGVWPGMAGWGALALLIDLGMLALVIGLDANYLETAATVSQRRYERRQRIRRGGIGGFGGRASAKWRIIPLPWLAGAGPIAWRQLTGALRSSRGLLLLLAIIALSTGTILLHHRGDQVSSIGTIGGAAVWINLFFVSMLKFDFREDLDRLDLLRSLPIHPVAMAAGQLVAPVVVLAVMQALLLAAAAVAAVSIPGAAKFLLAAAAFALPFDVLLVGIENLLFMMFPLRAAGLIAGDMQLFGRQMVVFFCKFLALGIVVALCAAVGAVGYYLSGKSWPVFGALAWVVLSLAAIGTVPLLAVVYSRFDPSVDTPA